MPERREEGPAAPRRRRRAPRRQVDPEALRQVSGRITALAEQRDPERRSVFVDGEFVLGLHLEAILRCGLKVGAPVDGETLVAAYALDLEHQAWEAGLRLLAAAPRTRRDVARRLGRRFPPATVERVLERLSEAGWLDDREYAVNYVRSHPDYGSRRLLAELVRKGVDREMAAEVVAAERGADDVREQARALAEARLRRMTGVDRVTAARRLAGYLARRGFGPETVRSAVAPLVAHLPDPPEPRRRGLQRRTPLGPGGRRTAVREPADDGDV
ncbi:MAG: regulatory protein RecX [Bacillota bacterium]|nr:MAG: hypothetical protein DIU55_00115 [Bacillota bacterium]